MMKRFNKVHLYRVLVGILLLAAWEFGSGTLISRDLISAPSQIFVTLTKWYSTSFIYIHLKETLIEMFIGFTIGTLLALPIGFILGINKSLASILNPFMVTIYSVPGVMLGPLFILWFGIGLLPKVIIVAITVFFLMFFNTFVGFKEVDQHLVNSVLLMGANRREIFSKVVLPSAMVWIFAGLKIATPYMLLSAIVGEMIASTKGLGFLILRGSQILDMKTVFAAIFNVLMLGIILTSLVNRIEKFYMRWKIGG